MFVRCETWLYDMQEVIWKGREWGRTANYVIPLSTEVNDDQEPVPTVQIDQGGVGLDAGSVSFPPVAPVEDEGMQEILSDMGPFEELDEFQWPS